MTKSEERKPLPKYTYVIVAVMAVVFVVRLFMPANFGTTFDKIGLDAKEITVDKITGTTGQFEEFFTKYVPADLSLPQLTICNPG